MAAMSATTTFGSAKPQVAPSFYTDGGFCFNDDEFGDFIMYVMALTVVDMTLEAFAYSRSQMAVLK